MRKNIVALFEDKTEAEGLIQEISKIGIPRTEISLLENPGSSDTTCASESTSDPSIWERLKSMLGLGIPEHEGACYAEGVRRGGTLVSVRAEENQLDRVMEVMAKHDAVDIDQRSAEWRQSGWSETGVKGSAGDVVMPVVEEELQVGRREVQRGGVRVYSHVTERPVEEDIRLRDERVRVERRAVNRAADPNQAAAFKEDVIEMTETAEEPVVSKRARVIEEVLISKQTTERTQTVRDTVRRTDVDVQQLKSQQGGGTSSFPSGDARHRPHYEANFDTRGYTFEQYSTAYRYGEHLATETPFGGGKWTAVEPEARRYWEERNPGTWNDFRDAVRYAWEQAQQKVAR